MALHIKITLILFYVNLMLLGFFPQYTFLAENIYEQDIYGEYTLDSDFEDSLTEGLSEESNSNLLSAFGFVDIFAGFILFFKFILQMFLGLPVLIYALQISYIVKLFAFFPVILLYGFALVGWFKR